LKGQEIITSDGTEVQKAWTLASKLQIHTPTG